MPGIAVAVGFCVPCPTGRPAGLGCHSSRGDEPPVPPCPCQRCPEVTAPGVLGSKCPQPRAKPLLGLPTWGWLTPRGHIQGEGRAWGGSGTSCPISAHGVWGLGGRCWVSPSPCTAQRWASGTKPPGLGETQGHSVPFPGPKVSLQTPKNSRGLKFSLLPRAPGRAVNGSPCPREPLSPGEDREQPPWGGRTHSTWLQGTMRTVYCPNQSLGSRPAAPHGAQRSLNTPLLVPQDGDRPGGDKQSRGCPCPTPPSAVPGHQCAKSAQPWAPHVHPAFPPGSGMVRRGCAHTDRHPERHPRLIAH